MTEFPDLLSLSPAMAERAWRKWLADRDPLEGELATIATNVTLAIRQLGLNIGKKNADEEGSRKNLTERYAAFQTKYNLAAD